MGELLHGAITEAIIGAAFEVHSTLGPGLIEAAYEAAMIRELEIRGLSVARQVEYKVVYKDRVVGQFFVDLLIEGKVLVELKATSDHHKVFEVQTIYYLKGSGLQVGLLLNFGMESVFRKRFVN